MFYGLDHHARGVEQAAGRSQRDENGGCIATVRLRQSAFKISSGDGLDCVVDRQLDDRSGLPMRLSETEEEEKSQ